MLKNPKEFPFTINKPHNLKAKLLFLRYFMNLSYHLKYICRSMRENNIPYNPILFILIAEIQNFQISTPVIQQFVSKE